MIKIISSHFFLLTTGIIFLAPIVFAQDSKDFADANNQFAFDLYAGYKSQTGNIFYSPHSISSALAMAFEGARGKTAAEMRTVFHFPADDSRRRDSLAKLSQRLKGDHAYVLHTANALWAQEKYPFLDEYIRLISKYYDGKVKNLDFVNQTEKSRLTINSWVARQTQDIIHDLIPQTPPALTPLTRLVLTNAVYFKGSWLKPFDTRCTKEDDFKTGTGHTSRVQMMCLFEPGVRFNYAETNTLQMIELPYKGQALSMLILLPKESHLTAIEESLNAKQLNQWKKLLHHEEVIVYLPKFKFATKYDLTNELKSMGMPTAFTPGIDFGGKADFSGMTGDKKLNIDLVIHQAAVDVGEAGTEAAAATSVAISSNSIQEPPKIFKADHPFVFLIQDKATGHILFLGRVSDPTK